MSNGKFSAAVMLLGVAIYAPQALADCSYSQHSSHRPSSYLFSGGLMRTFSAEKCGTRYVHDSEGSGFYVKSVREPRDTPGSIPGAAIAAEQSAPPASTAPQVGLYSVLHNVER